MAFLFTREAGADLGENPRVLLTTRQILYLQDKTWALYHVPPTCCPLRQRLEQDGIHTWAWVAATSLSSLNMVINKMHRNRDFPPSHPRDYSAFWESLLLLKG